MVLTMSGSDLVIPLNYTTFGNSFQVGPNACEAMAHNCGEIVSSYNGMGYLLIVNMLFMVFLAALVLFFLYRIGSNGKKNSPLQTQQDLLPKEEQTTSEKHPFEFDPPHF